MVDTPNYYNIIGVRPSATADEITVEFRRQVERFPKSAQDPKHNSAFRLLVTAYRILSDPESRTKYDQSLMTHAIGGPQALNLQLLTSQPSLQALDESQVLYFLLDITANPLLVSIKAPMNICLVIDQSTSMAGERISQVRTAASMLVERLKPKDTISIIGFSDFADIIVPAETVENQKIIQSKISQIYTGGATEIYQGLKLGISELHKAKRTSGVSHLILLTDGHTYGDEEACLSLARRSAQNMIGISALGIGDDWNDSFLDALVEPSGSVCAYMETPDQIISYIEKQLHLLNQTFAQDLQLRVESPKMVEIQSIHKLSPFPQPIQVSPWSMPLGLLQHDTPLTLLVETNVSPLQPGTSIYLRTEVSADIVATGQSSQRFATQTSVSINAEPSNVLPLPAVVRAVSKLRLYQMNEKAWDDLKQGEIEQATLRFEKLGSRLMSEGQTQLAATAFHEAEQIAKTGKISKAGRKKLKYGTRALVSNVNLS